MKRSQTGSGHLVALDDAVVAVGRRRLPTQMDGVVLLVAHRYGHGQRGRTGCCMKSGDIFPLS